MLEFFKRNLNEFKAFAVRGNVIDMAVGIIIGASFGKIVDSMVNDVIMPPLGLLLGKVDFTNMFLVMKEGATPAPYNSLAAAQNAGAVTWNFGLFINAVISFLIVAFAVFLLIKTINKLQEKMEKKEAKEVAVTTKTCPYCCSEIPLNATRCPHCTSELKDSAKKSVAKKK